MKEAALLLVVAGEAQIEAGGEAVDARSRATSSASTRTSGTAISTEGGVRILLTLAPWPGDGHYRGNDARGR